MAIEFKKASRKINWFAIIMTIILVSFAIIATYFLFIQESPLIEHFAPTIEARRAKIASLTLEPDTVRKNPVFEALREVPVFLDPLGFGRENPFIPFDFAREILFPIQPGEDLSDENSNDSLSGEIETE